MNTARIEAKLSKLENKLHSNDSMNPAKHKSWIDFCRFCGYTGTDEEVLAATPYRSVLELIDTVNEEARNEK